MATLGLSHVNFHAKRELLDALRDFYCEVVGLEEGYRPPFAAFGYWLYAGGQPIVHLFEAAPGEDRRTDIDSTFDHVAFDCANLAEAQAALQRRGIAHRVARVPERDQVQIFLKDPAGNGVELNFSLAARRAPSP
jgi:catechol 2,3-dioxygenase-like lactoylglutathione lyase family enzyme